MSVEVYRDTHQRDGVVKRDEIVIYVDGGGLGNHKEFHLTLAEFDKLIESMSIFIPKYKQ